MSNKNMKPCKFCGKLYEVCSYCWSHRGVYRWRNFFCSRECSEAYIRLTEEYRTSAAKERSDEIKAKAVSDPNIAAKSDNAEVAEVLTAVVPKKKATRAAKKAAATDENVIKED